MPFYKLICRECGNSFEKQASVAERAAGEIACTACGGTEHDPDYSGGSAAVHTASDAAACPNAHKCGGCCHGGGR